MRSQKLFECPFCTFETNEEWLFINHDHILPYEIEYGESSWINRKNIGVIND